MQRRLRLFSVLLAATVALGGPVAAQSPARDVVFDGFAFSLPEAIASSVNITVVPGEAADTESGPFGPLLPATVFGFYGPAQQPRRGGNLGEIRLIPVSAIQERDFESARLDALVTLLEEQPELDPLSDTPPENLPILPDPGAAQLIIGKAGYAGSETMAGVVYLTAFAQDTVPMTSDSFVLVFQGLSSDGATWISMAIPVSTELFPEEVSDEEFARVTTRRGWPRYLDASRAILAEAPPDAFTPSLSAVGDLLGSMAFPGLEPAP